MADAADIANDLAQEELTASLSRRKQFFGESFSNCEGCEQEIPVLRRQTLPGVTTCVDCQHILESKNNAYRKF